MRLIRRAILSVALFAGAFPAFGQVPPPVPALPDTERRTTYVIAASTCACNVNFALYGDSTDYTNWLEVFVNGVKIAQSGNWTLTSPTGSLATIPRPITDAVLTFTVSQTGTVQIVGARRPRRASQFTTQPSARDFNQVLTDIIAQNRETWDKINDVTGRTVQAPPGETLAMLPVLANRANMGACFDSLGNLTTCVAVPSSTFIAGNGITFTGVGPTTIAATTAMSFTHTGTGAVPVTINSIFQQTVTPEMFGALCNGTGDDGPAIQRAINSTGANPVDVALTQSCTYRVVTGIAWTKNGVTIRGGGRYSTYIDYEPGANASLFTIGAGGGVEATDWNIRDLSVISADTTHIKTAFDMIDTSSGRMHKVSCNQTGLLGGIWTGGAASVCLHTRGRDLSTFEDTQFGADFPIILDKNPTFPFLSADHYVFRDTYLVGANIIGSPCILTGNGATISNLTFEGHQAWARCAPGFQTNDSSSVGTWNNISFNNVRIEQDPSGGTLFGIIIQPFATLRGLIINNSEFGIRGISLRNVLGATISNNVDTCTAPTQLFLDIDATTDQISLVNNKLEAACTASVPGMTAMGAIANPSGSTVPASVTYFNSAARASILTASQTVASLPACTAASTGARAFVSDSSVTLTAAIGAVIGSGGANKVPVYCDGSNWRYGANDNIPVYLRRKIG